ADAPPRADGLLPCVFCRRDTIAAGAADPVRRLRRVAAPVASGRGDRVDAGLLEQAAGPRAAAAGAADRLPASAGADLHRRPAISPDLLGVVRRAAGARPQRRADAVYDRAGGVQPAARAL